MSTTVAEAIIECFGHLTQACEAIANGATSDAQAHICAAEEILAELKTKRLTSAQS